MAYVSKREADAHDRIMEAAAELVELMEKTNMPIQEVILEELAIYLAQHATQIKAILKPLKTTVRIFQDHSKDGGDGPD